jgi:protein ImuA
MSHSKAKIIAQLQREILPLQGLKHRVQEEAVDVGLPMMNAHFPNGCFPLGVVHEFFCHRAEDLAAAGGFVSGLLSTLAKNGGVTLWINHGPVIFPPALTTFGISPHTVLFLHPKKEANLLWALEEALRCNSLAAVVGEIPDLSFTASRRLQIAVEGSGVTCFLLRTVVAKTSSSCVAQWRIKPLPGRVEEGMPGLGFPRWQVELLKIRNGRPGSWPVEWAGGQFMASYPSLAVSPALYRKTG